MGTGIGWTDETWNPLTGCDRVSEGCDHCYALTLAKRLKGMGSAKYQNDGDPRTSGPGFGLTVQRDALYLPLRWRKPRMIFTNSMSDLFHKDVPAEYIAEVFAVMAACPQHVFQVLTKRHARLRSLLNDRRFADAVNTAYCCLPSDVPSWRGYQWPLPNVHVGVSAEDQHWAGIRIPALEKTLAAVRWVSAEPLLGPIDLTPWLPSLDWVVVGGESGRGHRQMDVGWLLSIVAQCQDAGVPVHVKQDSGPRSGMQGRIPDAIWSLKQFPREPAAVTG